MIPHPLVAVVLALGACRIMRIVGWDDMPWLVRARAWVTGEHTVTNASQNTRMGLTSEQVKTTTEHRRPVLQKFIECPWCAGAWISLLVYVAWRLEAQWTTTVLAVLALSEVVGLVSKNWDP